MLSREIRLPSLPAWKEEAPAPQPRSRKGRALRCLVEQLEGKLLLATAPTVLDMPATRYYQLLNELIDRPEALAYDPVLVKRLRAQRARRQRMRSPRPGGKGQSR